MSLSAFIRAQPKLYQNYFGGAGNDVANGISETSDGGYIIVGTYSVGFSKEAFLIKYSCDENYEWSKRYKGIGNSEGLDVKEAPDNGFVFTGITNNNDVLLAKTDYDGVLQWSKAYNFGVESGINLCVTPDSGFVITGNIRSGGGTPNVLAIRTDQNGDTLWAKKYGSSAVSIGIFDLGTQVISTKDNGFLIVGTTTNYGVSSTNEDIIIVKINGDGVLQWSKVYGTNNIIDKEYGNGVIELMDGGYIITGYALQPSTSNQEDIILFKTDSNGVLDWANTYGAISAKDIGNKIVSLDTNTYIIFGEYGLGFGGQDACAIYVDKNGNLNDMMTYGNSLDDRFKAGIISNKGGNIIIGETKSYSLSSEMYLVRTDTLGLSCTDSSFLPIQTIYPLQTDTITLIVNTLKAAIEIINAPISISTSIDDLPVSICEYNITIPDFSLDSVCKGDSLFFNNLTSGYVDSWKWYFGDGDSSDLINPNHLYISSDIYPCTLTVGYGCYADTVIKDMIVYELPFATLPDSVSMCLGDTVQINAGNIGADYLWSTGPTSQIMDIFQSGMYIVKITNLNDCVINDTVISKVNSLPIINLGIDTSICLGDSVILNAFNLGNRIAWSTGDSTSSITINTTGTYSVDIIDTNGCEAEDEVLIVVVDTLNIYLGNDTSLCVGDSLVLSSGIPGADYYQWNTGDSSSAINIKESGIYIVEVNKCGIDNDTINIIFNSPTILDLWNDTSVCGSYMISPGISDVNYYWSTGDTSEYLLVDTTGTYFLNILDSNGCKSMDSIFIIVYSIPFADAGPNDTIYYGEPVILMGTTNASYFYWIDSIDNLLSESLDNSLIPNQTNYYVFNVIDSNGCYNSDTVTIYILHQLKYFIPNSFSPNNDGFNDKFDITGSGMLSAEIYIYSRLGEMVYSANVLYDNTYEKIDSWDGINNNGKILPDTYAYHIKILTTDNKQVDIKGNLLLTK